MDIKDFKELPNFSNRLLRVLNSVNDKVANILIDLANSKEESIKMLDFITDNDEIVISFLPIGKEPVYSGIKWNKQNRQRGKIGKTFKNFIHSINPSISFTDRELELFVNTFKSKLSGDLSFKLVSGEDIRKYYNEENYYIDEGSLGNSCMRYYDCQKYFDIYTNNPNCEMLIIFDKRKSEDLIVGRALVWTLGGQKYVDRRYGCSEVYETAIVEYAKSQKWSYKSHNTYDLNYSTYFMVFDGHNYNEKQVFLSFEYNQEIEFFPYADTVCFLQNGIMSNNRDGIDDGEWGLAHETCGYLDTYYKTTCPNCGKVSYFLNNEIELCENCYYYCSLYNKSYLKEDCVRVIYDGSIYNAPKSEIGISIFEFIYSGKTYYYHKNHNYWKNTYTVEVKPGIHIHVALL